ncbi:MAG: hypothetical protein ACE15C_16090 [Phycisphaerae bacterium]
MARLTRIGTNAVLVLILACLGWRWLCPTSSAIAVFDSPDGKYRCAVFYANGYISRWSGRYEYEAGLFRGSWPHRELPGERVQWTYDSVSSSDFRVAWRQDGADLDFCTGYGDRRATKTVRVAGGRQKWEAAVPEDR